MSSEFVEQDLVLSRALVEIFSSDAAEHLALRGGTSLHKIILDTPARYSEDIDQATADQTIVQSKRAVEIETLKAQAEVEPLRSVAKQLSILKQRGPDVLAAYRRNVRLKLYAKAKTAILEANHDR
jgi:predicted nucleotidyltransferase component of viral defense system